MAVLFYLLLIISGITAVFYAGMTIQFYIGWKRIKPPKPSLEPDSINVSVIIAARNEEENILNCLTHLIQQSYENSKFEIIVCDDNSTDATYEICVRFAEANPLFKIKIVRLSESGLFSKKEAIRAGIEKAEGDLILTTDADCCPSKNWIKGMVQYYLQNSYKIISGPVTYEQKPSLFQKFQLLDFLSMIISGAGAIGINKAFICNAANMAFEKDLYKEINAIHYDKNLASGDDVFFLHKTKEKYPGSVGFIKSEDAIVITKPQETIMSFFSQRIRWASKSKAYRDKHALLFSVNVFNFNFCLVLSLLLGFFNDSFWVITAILYLIKLILDFPLIYAITGFSKSRNILKHYLWIQLLYPFYIVLAAVLSLTLRQYTWKGRKLT